MKRAITALACLLSLGGTAAPAWAQEGTADLSVTIAWAMPGTAHVRSGNTAKWVVTVRNLGPATAPAVYVNGSGSDQFAGFSSTCGVGNWCAVGDLPPGESRSVTFYATACLTQTGDEAPIRRVWWVTGSAESTVLDPSRADNFTSLDVRITGPSARKASCWGK